MPGRNISQRDLDYLRSQTRDRDEWSRVLVDYYVLDESAITVDDISKEVEEGDKSFKDPVKIPASLTIREPSRPVSSRQSGDAAGPEHTVVMKMGVQKLRDRSIAPKPKDEVEIQGIRYLIIKPAMDEMVRHSPFNLDVAFEIRRKEGQGNLDLGLFEDVES